MASQFLPDAIDLSHHISELSKRRQTSPLKGLAKYLSQPGLISVAGGMPNPSYFPFTNLSAEVLVPETFPVSTTSSTDPTSSLSWLWNLFSSSKDPTKTSTISVPRYPTHDGELNLAQMLQYSTATGTKQLQDVIKEYSSKVYRPAYSDWTVLVHTGNTDGWTKAFMTFCNPGEGILCSEWTYPSALSSALPFGVNPVSVGMDSQGMSAVALRKVLVDWDAEERGMPRPHVMYLVPIGQNPTGATMGPDRKKAIYEIRVEYDIIIVEDDPYFVLQHGEYTPKKERQTGAPERAVSDSEEAFIESLTPSFLRFDYQGRVVRMDTFSKTIAPGCRLGWFTCNPLFAERLERQSETSSQAPCGFAQAMVASLLLQWHYSGYIRWLQGLRAQYTDRRNNFVDLLMDEFEFHPSKTTTLPTYYQGDGVVLTAYSRHPMTKARRQPIAFSEKQQEALDQYDYGNRMFSFIPPTSGMFVWIRIHLEDHPSYRKGELGYKHLEKKLWVALAENNLLTGFGSMFYADTVTEETRGDGHLRMAFSDVPFDTMKKAIEILGKTFRKFFDEALV